MAIPQTERRSGRAAGLLIKPQAAQGTLQDNLSDAKVLWDLEAGIDADTPLQEPEETMDSDDAADESGEVDTFEGPRGTVLVHASPESLEYLLRSNWGPLAGGTFGLKTQVNEWMTLAWVENVDGAGSSKQRLVRIRDAWFHQVVFQIENDGYFLLEGHYAGTSRDRRKLDALAGVTLPAAPMGATDKNVFPGLGAKLIRDPDGLNEEIPFESLQLTISQGLSDNEYWMSEGGWDVAKQGKVEVDLELTAPVCEETWKLIDDAAAKTRRHYRITASAPNPAKTLQVDLLSLLIRTRPLRRDGDIYQPLQGLGRSRRGSGGFMTISLT